MFNFLVANKIDEISGISIPLGALGIDIFMLAIFVIVFWLCYKMGFKSTYWLFGNIAWFIFFMVFLNKPTEEFINKTVSGITEDVTLKTVVDNMINATYTAIRMVIIVITGNLILMIPYFIFFKKWFNKFNKSQGKMNSKIVGLTSALLLAPFIAYSFSTIVYLPLIQDQETILLDSNFIGHEKTDQIKRDVFKSRKTLSLDEINAIVRDVNAINEILVNPGEVDGQDAINKMFDIIDKITSNEETAKLLPDMIGDVSQEATLSDLTDNTLTQPDVDKEYWKMVEIFKEPPSKGKDTRFKQSLEVVIENYNPNAPENRDISHYPAYSQEDSEKIVCGFLPNATNCNPTTPA